MFAFAADFLRHRFTAKTRHGVHSPFVYELIDRVIYDRAPLPGYSPIEKRRNELLGDHRLITITDLGAGSMVNNNTQKKISEIARIALKPPELAQLLYRLTAHFQPSSVVELGTCLGITTAYLAKAVPGTMVTSVEGCPEIAAVAAATIAGSGAENVNLLTGNFDDLFPVLISGLPAIGLVFIDGNHLKQATLDYFRLCLQKVNEESLLIFDDIYLSQGMKEAWAEIKSHPDVTLTIDLFWIGLVFFRKGRVKEEFKIRF